MYSGRQHGILFAALLAILLAHDSTGAAQPDSPIVDGSFNTSDAARIHYLRAGQQTSAPALILLPGWTLPAELWTQ
jgi:hypothetical protein